MRWLSRKNVIGYRVLKITDLANAYFPLCPVCIGDSDDRVNLIWRTLNIFGLFDLVRNDFFKLELLENVPSLINADWQYAALYVVARYWDCRSMSNIFFLFRFYLRPLFHLLVRFGLLACLFLHHLLILKYIITS